MCMEWFECYVRDEAARFISFEFRRCFADVYRSSNNNPGLSWQESLRWTRESRDIRFDIVVQQLRESIEEDLLMSDERTKRFVDKEWLATFYWATEAFQDSVIRHAGL